MAALVFVLCSALDELYRVGRVFVRSRGSVEECRDYVVSKREELLIKRYLDYLDERDCVNEKSVFHSRSVKSKKRRNRSIDDNMAYQEIYEFTPTDIVDYGSFETEDMDGFQVVGDTGLVYSCANLKDVVPGSSYFVTGNTLNNCERFSVNFAFDATGRDIALHINPRLPQNYIVRNCKVNGHWAKEEVTSALPFCLERGKRFTMQILLTETEFYISVNGTHFAAFKHRLPYSRIQCLQVKGDVSDVEVEYLNVLEYPDRHTDEGCGKINDISIVDYVSAENINELLKNCNDNQQHMPYYGKLSSNFACGTQLHIVGRVKVLPHSFFVNLQKGDKIWPHPSIAFHLNPRFAMVGGKHVICRNSWFDGKWDREERSEIKTDFMPSRPFHLTIHCTDTSYCVYLNDKFISEYQFRVRADIVDTVYIQGDIKLRAVILERQQRPVENLL